MAALEEKEERALPNPPPPEESRAGVCRPGEGSTAKTSEMLFFDPPSDNRPSIPLADLPFVAPVLPEPALQVLATLSPPPLEDCLLIAGDLARAETFTRRALEPINVSQASSVSSDHRVNSCDGERLSQVKVKTESICYLIVNNASRRLASALQPKGAWVLAGGGDAGGMSAPCLRQAKPEEEKWKTNQVLTGRRRRANVKL